MPWVQMGVFGDGLAFDPPPRPVCDASLPWLPLGANELNWTGRRCERRNRDCELVMGHDSYRHYTTKTYKKNNMSSILWVTIKINSIEGTKSYLKCAIPCVIAKWLSSLHRTQKVLDGFKMKIYKVSLETNMVLLNVMHHLWYFSGDFLSFWVPINLHFMRSFS